MSFYEQHYNQCKLYIDTCYNPQNYTKEKIKQITENQRVSESLFTKIIMGRKNITYPKLCIGKKTKHPPSF